MRFKWNWRKFLPVIAMISAIIFIVSGYAAHRMAPIDNEVSPDGNGFSTAILLVIFVTIPAFCLLVLAVLVGVVESINRRRS
jgi:hypothetical protein